MTVAIAKCLACLEVTSVNHDGLCEGCELQNDSLDGSLLALLTAEKAVAEDE